MRAIWKGAISFGLVNIPVRLYTASHEKEVSFVLLHKKDFSQVRYARICKSEDKEVPWNEIVKGYEYEDGNYVVLDDADFEKANLKKTKTIEILNFVSASEIESLYYVKPYFLEPEKNAHHAYSLLLAALNKSKKVGLAKYVLRNKEHLAVIKVHENMLILNEMRYQNELVIPQDLKLPGHEKLNSKEIEIAIQLIDHLTIPFKPDVYTDTYSAEIKEIIRQKAKGKPIHPKIEKQASSKIVDMMELLQESLKSAKKPLKKPSKRPA